MAHLKNWLLIFILLWSLGCNKTERIQQPMPPPIVTVAPPITRELNRFEYFTGRTEAAEQVEIRAKVSGYLLRVLFKPGTEVEKNAPLFEIDPELFKAANAISQADIEYTKARSQQAKAELVRSEQLRKTGAVSQAEYEKALADKLVSDAAIEASKAKAIGTQLNVDYCTIRAPMSGLIGDKLVSDGNLVIGGQSNTTLLTTIMSVDPMDITFELDENTYQRIQKEILEKKITLAQNGKILVEAGLAVHGQSYPLKGQIIFLNNKVDSKTGTIRVKAQFANPKQESGTRLLTTGMFARVRVPMGAPFKALLVPDAALLTDQEAHYLYIVGADKKAVRLEAEVGVLDGDYREITSVR